MSRILAVARDAEHRFSKPTQDGITLIAGIGIDGDAHAGTTVKHRSRVRRDPSQANLRQVHLIHAELFDYVAEFGFDVEAGDLGENITTAGIDLLRLPRGARLQLEDDAVVEVTGLRNPAIRWRSRAARRGVRSVCGSPTAAAGPSRIRGPMGTETA